jgi:HK97 family phage prohead protease
MPVYRFIDAALAGRECLPAPDQLDRLRGIIPLLFAHKADQPIGFPTVTETPLGRLVKGKLLLDTVARAYARIKVGSLKAFSVGFRLPSDGFSIKQGVRVISKAILKENSLVIFPANPLVTALKQGEDESSPLVSLIKWI